MADQVFVQVRYKMVHEGHEFNDCLYFTEPEYASTTQGKIEDMKQARFDKWVAVIVNPPPAVEPTKEQLEEMEAMLLKQLEEVQAQIVAKTPPPAPEPEPEPL